MSFVENGYDVNEKGKKEPESENGDQFGSEAEKKEGVRTESGDEARGELDTELGERLRSEAREVEIPKALKPENIEKLLVEKGRRKRRIRPIYTIAAAAACCMIVIGAAAWGLGIRGDSDGKHASARSESASASGSGKLPLTGTVPPEQKIASAKDYDEVYQYIEAEKKSRDKAQLSYGYARGADENASAAAGSFSSYSDTNIRQEGVDEGDIVKTDGKHLFILDGHQIQIVDIRNPKMEPIGAIRMAEGENISEFYVKDDRLVVAYTSTETTHGDGGHGDGGYGNNGYSDSGGYGKGNQVETVAETYDVSSPDRPESIGKVTQSGSYYTMRISGDEVYLFSSFYAQVQAARKDVAAYIPEVQGKPIDSDRILMPQYVRGDQYTVVTSFTMKKPGEEIDSKAILGNAGLVYVSNQNIYVCESYYNPDDSDVTQTCIRKVAYKDGKLEAVGQTRIEGTLNDSFSIDEYQGNLRLVTTISGAGEAMPFPLVNFDSGGKVGGTKGKDCNVLYILDKNLKKLSSLDGLAEDEKVYSARFMGDTGYFVTYKQVDPLFSVDLSDPKKPKITGELKLPGFSDYLHTYGDGLLLGIGMDVDEAGTTTNGVKLSMFDVSHPADVKEVSKYVLKDMYSTNIPYNYKTALISTDRNLIGFSAYGEGQHYYLFSYDKKKGFQCVFDQELSGYSEGRGVYVGDTFYLVAGNTVESFAMGTFQKIDDLVL